VINFGSVSFIVEIKRTTRILSYLDIVKNSISNGKFHMVAKIVVQAS
jgi:hypothetical protein